MKIRSLFVIIGFPLRPMETLQLAMSVSGIISMVLYLVWKTKPK